MKKILSMVILTTAITACNSGGTGNTSANNLNQIYQSKLTKGSNILSLEDANVKGIDNTLNNIPVAETGLKILQLTNNSISSSVRLQSLPTLPNGFSYNKSRTTCGNVLAPNQSCNISIKFIATAQSLSGVFKFYVQGNLSQNCGSGKQSCEVTASKEISYYSRTYMYFSQYNQSTGASNIKECLINKDGSISAVNCKNVLSQKNNLKYTIAVQSYTEGINTVFAIPVQNGAKGPLQKCDIINNDTGELACTPFSLDNTNPNYTYPIFGDSYSTIFEYDSNKILLSTIPQQQYPMDLPQSMNANQVYACNLHLFKYIGINFEGCLENRNYVNNVTTPANYEMYLTDLLPKNNPVYYFRNGSGADNSPALVLCPNRNTPLSKCKNLASGEPISSISYYNNSDTKRAYIQYTQNDVLYDCSYNSAALGSCDYPNSGRTQAAKVFNYGDNIYLINKTSSNILKLSVCKNNGQGAPILNSCSQVNIASDKNYNIFDINMLQPIALMSQ